MIQDNSIVAIITARGGSKGVPDKNIKLLGNKPLIAYAIDAAKRSNYIDRIIVSTDSEKIALVSKDYGADVPFLRPHELATDEAPSNLVIIHTLEWLKKNEKLSNYFILLQPTSPFRTVSQIDESIEKFMNDKENTSLMSVNKISKSPYWMKKVNSVGYLDDFIKQEKEITRRQDAPQLYILNGAIYISECERYLSYKNFDTSKLNYYLMDENTSLDIDTLFDFRFAEIALSEMKNNES